jgi:hypothetical protein
MDKLILQDVGRVERKKYLRDSARESKEFTYPRALSAEEISILKDQFFQKRVAMAKLEDDKKEFMAEWKSKMKPFQLEVKNQMSKLRSGVEEMNEMVFLLPEHDEGMIGYYSAEGVLVYQRPLMPEEKQFSIVDNSHKQTGTE